MKKAEIEPDIMVCGDNSLGQLWCKKDTQVAAKFTNANDFPFESKINKITKLSAYNQSIAFCFDDSHIVFRNEEGKISEFNVNLIQQIFCLEKNVLALSKDGKIFDCESGEYYQESDFIEIAASKLMKVAIKTNGEVVLLKSTKSQSQKVFDGPAIKVGCTEDEIFIVNKEGNLIVYSEGNLVSIPTKVPLISVSSSDTECVFIDVNGGLWHYNYGSLIQVFGLPPIVYVSVGVQHFAAISFDGSLYMWGFNPSGQLGIGSDRPSLDPIRVLENIRLVCCGTHHTLAVRGGLPDIPEELNRGVLAKFAPTILCARSNVSRAEILC